MRGRRGPEEREAEIAAQDARDVMSAGRGLAIPRKLKGPRLRSRQPRLATVLHPGE